MALAFFREKEKRYILEQHQYCNSGNKVVDSGKLSAFLNSGKITEKNAFWRSLAQRYGQLVMPCWVHKRKTLCVGHAAVLAKHTYEVCTYLPDHGGTMTRAPVGRPLLEMEEFKVR